MTSLIILLWTCGVLASLATDVLITRVDRITGLHLLLTLIVGPLFVTVIILAVPLRIFMNTVLWRRR